VIGTQDPGPRTKETRNKIQVEMRKVKGDLNEVEIPWQLKREKRWVVSEE
jgi:hypothetical protein